MSARVFVVNQRLRRDGSRLFDLRAAERFGALVDILPPGRIEMSEVEMIRGIAAGLADYDPARDHLLGIGDMAACLIAASIAAWRGGGVYRILRWDDDDQDYRSVAVDLAADGRKRS